MTTAVCPGSFDPVTNGHLDIIERAARIFDRVLITVFRNSSKNPLFTVEERVEMIREATSHLHNVEVESADGLLMNYVREKGAKVIIKGLRAIQDFEYEFQMGMINKKLDPEVETMFMITGGRYSYLSSSIVKELASYGTRIEGLVPKPVEERLIEKFRKK